MSIARLHRGAASLLLLGLLGPMPAARAQDRPAVSAADHARHLRTAEEIRNAGIRANWWYGTGSDVARAGFRVGGGAALLTPAPWLFLPSLLPITVPVALVGAVVAGVGFLVAGVGFGMVWYGDVIRASVREQENAFRTLVGDAAADGYFQEAKDSSGANPGRSDDTRGTSSREGVLQGSGAGTRR